MKHLFTAFLLFFSTQGQAQIQTFEKGLLYWTGYYLEWELSDKFQLDAEIDNRRLIKPSQQYQTIARATLLYMKNDQFNFGGGIAYSSLFSFYTTVAQPEIRPHQEVSFRHGERRWSFNHRIRLEQRFRGDTVRFITPEQEILEDRINSYSFTLRTRYEFSTDFSLLDRDNRKGHWNLQVATEVMVNADIEEYWDTGRIYAGLQYYLDDSIRLEFGYLKTIEHSYEFERRYNYDNIRFTWRQKI